MFSGRNSQRNLSIMQRTFREMDQEVRNLAGHIPHDEFDRLTRRVADFGVRMNTTGQNSRRQLGLMRTSLREMEREITRVSGGGRERERVVNITARDRTGPGLRRSESRIRSWIMGPLRGMGGLIGGTLSDGIGQGVVGAFRSPAFGAIVVAAIAAALSVVGAAIAGALVFALGGAFVAIASMSAIKSKEIQRNWKEAAKNIGKDLAQAGEPLIPVIHRAIHVLEGMSSEFAPHFREAMEKAAPHLDDFVQRTRDGFKKMGQHAWDDLQEAFRVFVAAFGPMWEDFLAEFGKSLGALARTVSDHSTEIAAAFRVVLGMINLLVDTINFFANAWVTGMHMMIDSTAFLLKGVAFITDQIISFFGSILDAAVASFSWIPGVGPQLEQAQAAFATFRDGVNQKFENMSLQVKQFGIDMDVANRKRKLEVDIESWQSQLARAKEELKSVPPEKRSELKATIADLTNKISQAQGALNSMQKDYYVRIHAYRVGDWATGGGGPFAHGGVVGSMGRAATGGVRSNMTMVGEHGPEIVNLPPGSHVRSNPDSRRMMAQGGSEQQAPTIVFKSSGRRSGDLLIELLREEIHRRGGDPVIVLGGSSNGR